MEMLSSWFITIPPVIGVDKGIVIVAFCIVMIRVLDWYWIIPLMYSLVTRVS